MVNQLEAYYKKLGPIWKDYTLGKFISSGSYGKVWELILRGQETKEALKEVRVPPESAGGLEEAYLQGLNYEGALHYYQGMKKRALDEVLMMKHLSYCKEIVQFREFEIRELGKTKSDFGWIIFIRMELLIPLKQRLKNNGISVIELCHLGIDLCNALIVLREEGIVHRDIKPENIFYDSATGKFKLGDFGISCYASRETEVKGLPGTLTHMSPEVYQGKMFTYEDDLYAVGMILYKLLNDNRIPFLPLYPEFYTSTMRNQALYKRLQGEDIIAASIIYSNKETKHPTLKVTEETLEIAKKIEKIARKAIASKLQNRYSSVEELKSDIEEIID